MATIQKIENGKFLLETKGISIKTMFADWKIWLTKKEVSDIYWVKKSDIKKDLNNTVINSNLKLSDNIKKIYNEKKDKIETYYSLDVLILLGYKSKHFKETKFLVNTNTLIKEYASSRKHRLNNFYPTPIVNKIIKYINPILKII